MILAGEHQRASAIHVQVSVSLQTTLPSALPHDIEQSSLCYTAGPYCFSILNVALWWACTHWQWFLQARSQGHQGAESRPPKCPIWHQEEAKSMKYVFLQTCSGSCSQRGSALLLSPLGNSLKDAGKGRAWWGWSVIDKLKLKTWAPDLLPGSSTCPIHFPHLPPHLSGIHSWWV